MGTDTLTMTDFINVRKPPLAVLTPTGPTSFCTGGSVLLQANNGNLTYQWKRDGKFISGATSSSCTAVKSGSYKVITTNIYGCTSTSVPVSVSAEPSAVLTVNGPSTFCAGDSVLLSGNTGPGFSYGWKFNNVLIPGATDQFYWAKNAGKYNVKVTNLNGCTTFSSGKSLVINCRVESQASEGNNVKARPNPADEHTWLNVYLNEPQDVTVNLYDAIGNQVLQSAKSRYDAGNHDIGISLKTLRSGIYFCKIITGETIKTVKLVISR